MNLLAHLAVHEPALFALICELAAEIAVRMETDGHLRELVLERLATAPAIIKHVVEHGPLDKIGKALRDFGAAITVDVDLRTKVAQALTN